MLTTCSATEMGRGRPENSSFKEVNKCNSIYQVISEYSLYMKAHTWLRTLPFVWFHKHICYHVKDFLCKSMFDCVCALCVKKIRNPIVTLVFTSQVLSGHEGPISCLAFANTHYILASGAWDKKLKLWDVFQSRGAKETITLMSDGKSRAV